MKEFNLSHSEALNFPFASAIDAIHFSEQYKDNELIKQRFFNNADHVQIKEYINSKRAAINPEYKEELKRQMTLDAARMYNPDLVKNIEMEEMLRKQGFK